MKTMRGRNQNMLALPAPLVAPARLCYSDRVSSVTERTEVDRNRWGPSFSLHPCEEMLR